VHRGSYGCQPFPDLAAAVLEGQMRAGDFEVAFDRRLGWIVSADLERPFAARIEVGIDGLADRPTAGGGSLAHGVNVAVS
jgi:hypothetical protein